MRMGKMHSDLTFGAILFLFVLNVYCNESSAFDEYGRILVPTAPVNVSIRFVTANEIQLSWARPTSTQKKDLSVTRARIDETVTYNKDTDGTLVGLLSDVRSNDFDTTKYYQRDQLLNDDVGKTTRQRRSYPRRHRKRRQENVTTTRKTNEEEESTAPTVVFTTTDLTVQPLGAHTIESSTKSTTVQSPEESQPLVSYVLYYEEGGAAWRRTHPVTIGYDVRDNSVFFSDRCPSTDNCTGHARNITLIEESGRKGRKGSLYNLKDLQPFTPYKIWLRAYFAPKSSLDSNYSDKSNDVHPGVLLHREVDYHVDMDVLKRLGPSSAPIYVITDVIAPQAPLILNLTCQQPPGTLFIQWRRPDIFLNSIDNYFVTLHRIAESDTDKINKNYSHSSVIDFVKQIAFNSTKEEIETSVSLKLDTSNSTTYEANVIAATKSIIYENLLFNGSNTESQKVRMSPDCVPVPLAMSPPLSDESVLAETGLASDPHALDGTIVSLLCVIVLVLVGLGLIAGIIYWSRSRLGKCLSAAYSYLEEGGVGGAGGEHVVAGGAHVRKYCKAKVTSPKKNSQKDMQETPPPVTVSEVSVLRLADPRRPPVPRALFAAHVASLHTDGDIGFSKEYELVQARSLALGHTSHYSHRPENRHKNRYLNITAYDHSRVCLLPGSSPCCADTKEAKKHSKDDGCSPGNCDYINANFIDGIVACINDNLKMIILKKHDQVKERLRRKQLEAGTRRKTAAAEKAAALPTNSEEQNVETRCDNAIPEETANEIESAFLNIEFSGIVESDEDEEANRREGEKLKIEKAINIDIANCSEDDEDDVDIDLDDLFLDIDDRKVQVRGEWLVWRKRYIATQGPTPATLDAFWRMVWDHHITTIVMITNLIERGRRKCDMYWPKEGTASFGIIEVTIVHEDIMATYTVRTFQIRHIKHCCKKGSSCKSSQEGTPVSDSGEQPYRLVRQFHYTVWPDHGTPDHPLSVLHFVREAGRNAQSNPQGGGVLVHCSAGVGRTGTYIVLDAMLNHLHLTNTINVFGFLCHVRTQRNFLVQTEEQYIFIHEALLEAIQSEDTNIPISDMKAYIKELLLPLAVEALEVQDIKKIESDYVNVSGREMEVARLGAEESLTDGSTSNSRPKVSNSMIAEANSSADSLKINGNVSGSDKHFDASLEMDAVDTRLKGYNSRSESNLAVSEKPEFRPLSNCLDTRKAAFLLNGIRKDPDSKSTINHNSKDISNEESITDDRCIYAVTEISKDVLRRNNKDENYELLERMWSVSSNGQRQREMDDGYQPTNLLEKQFKLLRRCNAVYSAAKSQHNENKNRHKGILPADSSRVLLVPKPGQEGSDYINAVWVQGRRRVREYISAQHPPVLLTPPSSPGESASSAPLTPASDFWRMLWDHTCQIVVVLSNIDTDRQCQRFWPTVEQPQQIYGNYRVCYLSQKKFSPRLRKYEDCSKCHRPRNNKHATIDSNAISTKKESVKIYANMPDANSEMNETEINGYGEDHVNSFYHRQGSIENQDEERLISPKAEDSQRNVDPKSGEVSGTNEARNLLDRTELRIENLNKNKPEFGDTEAKKAKLSARKSIANGDLFASLTECSKRNAAGPKSPSKMSLKNFKIGSPVLKSPNKFKFPDFASKISFNADKSDADKKANASETINKCDEFVSCFEFVSGDVSNSDSLVITETTLSMHSLQDDYELAVKIVECPDWMMDEEIQSRLKYEVSSEGAENDQSTLGQLRTYFKNAACDSASDYTAMVDEFLRPLRMVFTLPEFVGRCQMEFKNSPVVVVDKFGGVRCSTLCLLNTAAASVSASARDPVADKVPSADAFADRVPSFDAYACAALHACRRGVDTNNALLPNASVWSKPGDLLMIYSSLAAYGDLLEEIGFRTPLCGCVDNT